ncbi:MAG: hypothetical protein OXB84_07585 [Halobacteriovoraceae bacterium]|nr:hypothetical protein [Halobacteriovoraceae bacterium]
MEEKVKKEREKNLKFFEQNLDTWLKDVAYKHKHVIIFDQKVQKVFDKFSDALEYAVPRFPNGEFIIQHVIGKDEQVGFLKLAI